ncbi:hypothetical protein GCM10020255_024470 [Rhodococcus baikonurensis]
MDTDDIPARRAVSELGAVTAMNDKADGAVQETCFWKCGDTAPDHEHYTVIVRENGRLLGRLAPGGRTTTRKIRASLLSKATATRIAGEINGDKDAGADLCAKVAKF